MTRRTLLFIRWGVFIAACAFLYLRLMRHQSMDVDAALFSEREPLVIWTSVAIVLWMMLVNWGIEAEKWRLLMRPLESLGFWRSYAATLAGTSIGIITPNRTGEFVGRVLFLRPEHRWQGSFATGLGSIAQFVITMVIGAAAFLTGTLHRPGVEHSSSWQEQAWIAASVLIAVVTLFLYFSPRTLRKLIDRTPFMRRWDKEADILTGYGTRQLVVVLALSTLRYFVFWVQFVVLLVVMGNVQPAFALLWVPVVFLISTLVPTVMLTDLGVRESASVMLLSESVAHDQGVFLASTSLWLINLALPAIIGSVILLVAHIRTSESRP